MLSEKSKGYIVFKILEQEKQIDAVRLMMSIRLIFFNTFEIILYLPYLEHNGYDVIFVDNVKSR